MKGQTDTELHHGLRSNTVLISDRSNIDTYSSLHYSHLVLYVTTVNNTCMLLFPLRRWHAGMKTCWLRAL